ncbi:MAG: hypothetical protein ABSG99_09440 [Sedimentisphaerales bacterium]
MKRKQRYTSSINLINWSILLFLVIAGVSLGTILEKALGTEGIHAYVIPRSGDIFDTLYNNFPAWIKAVFFTCSMSLVAVLLSTLLGITFGSLFALFRLWAFDRISQLAWSTPLVAVSVYLILLLGAGWAYGLAMGVFLGFYPIAKHSFEECIRKHEGVSALTAAFSLSRFQEFRHLRFSMVISRLGTALGTSVPLCFIGQTMAEYFIGSLTDWSPGLGGMLKVASNSANPYGEMWCSILLMMTLVFCCGKLIDYLWGRLYPETLNKQEAIV